MKTVYTVNNSSKFDLSAKWGGGRYDWHETHKFWVLSYPSLGIIVVAGSPLMPKRSKCVPSLDMTPQNWVIKLSKHHQAILKLGLSQKHSMPGTFLQNGWRMVYQSAWLPLLLWLSFSKPYFMSTLHDVYIYVPHQQWHYSSCKFLILTQVNSSNVSSYCFLSIFL